MAHERRVTKTVPRNFNCVGVHLTNNRSISSNSTMADPFEPTSPPPPPEATPPPEVPPTTQSTGLPSNIAAALACIPLVGGLIFWFLEKHDNFVRFYAMQSIIFGCSWILFWIVYSMAFAILSPIPAVGLVFRILLWAVWLVAGVTFLVVWIIA